MTQELVDVELNISCDLAQKRRRDVTTRVEGNRRASAVWMPELFVGPTLSNFRKPLLLQKLHDLTWLKDWYGSHASCDLDLSHADELGLHFGLTILQEHFQNLAQILLNLVDISALRVSARPTRHVADEKAGISVSFNYNIVRPHNLVL
jgi:hypothetical protein